MSKCVGQRAALVSLGLIALAGSSFAGSVEQGAVRSMPHAGRSPGIESPSEMTTVRRAGSGLPASMTVSIVRSADPGCVPDCPEWIAAQGMIDASAPGKFKKVLAAIGSRKLPVLIDSGGGTVDDGLAVGRLIRASRLDVIVAKPVPASCLPVDKGCKAAAARGIAIGIPDLRLAKCASSCAFVLAGGSRRIVSATAFVGVHQLKTLRTTAQIQQKFRIDRHMVWGVPTGTRRTLISERLINKKTVEAKTPESAYTKVAAYFNEMGIGPAIMPMLRSTPNSSIHWLSRAELKGTGMATITQAPAAFQMMSGVATPR